MNSWSSTAERFADECVRLNADIIEHVGTNNSARDMDAIRRALGEDTISYYGFSYGSELGGVWATLFPETVRAAVFDGALDPEADPLESNLQQDASFEASLSSFLARCSADDECAFHNDGDAEGAFDLLLAELDDDPLPSNDGRPPVNRMSPRPRSGRPCTARRTGRHSSCPSPPRRRTATAAVCSR